MEGTESTPLSSNRSQRAANLRKTYTILIGCDGKTQYYVYIRALATQVDHKTNKLSVSIKHGYLKSIRFLTSMDRIADSSCMQ